MRVTAQGHKRNAGTRTIFDDEIVYSTTEEDEPYPVHLRNILYMKKSKSDGSITMSIEPRSLSGFGGDYRLSVHLSVDEIVKLYLECFPQIRDVTARVLDYKPRKPEPIDIKSFLNEPDLRTLVGKALGRFQKDTNNRTGDPISNEKIIGIIEDITGEKLPDGSLEEIREEVIRREKAGQGVKRLSTSADVWSLEPWFVGDDE
jgi:hypothetical protein